MNPTRVETVWLTMTSFCMRGPPFVSMLSIFQHGHKEEAQKKVFALWDKDPESFISEHIGGAEALDWTVDEEDIEVKSVESPQQSQGSCMGVTQ